MKKRVMLSGVLAVLFVPFAVNAFGETIPISTIEELQSIGTGEYPMNGDYVLTGDLDASATISWNGGHGFAPLGNETNRFMGTLDGQGHTITGLLIARDEEYVGIFKLVGSSGTVKSIKFNNCHVTGYKRTGIVAGENKGTLQGISLNSECRISGKLYVGSITGYLETGGTVADCTFSGQIEGVGSGSSYGRIGGIAGIVRSNASITNCRNEGIVLGINEYTGGITGTNTGTISRCFVNYKVEGQDYYTGGIAGLNDIIGTIENCCVGGMVDGGYYTGGVVGHNEGIIEYTGTLGTASVNGYKYVGGFAGMNERSIRYCYSQGEVTADGSNDYIGGFVGYSELNPTDIIKQCVATGNVYAENSDYVGGFIGYLSDGTAYVFVGITECYAQGSVIGDDYVGGFIGDYGDNEVLISECYSTGQVAGDYRIGGFAGYMSYNSMIMRSYWDIDASGLGYSDGGTGRYTDEMQRKDYYENWDWAFVWAIEEGVGYPYLQEMPPACMPDNNPPVLTLLGESSVEHACGESYTDMGATAADGCDGDLTGAIQIDGVVDINTPDTYTLTYSVSDLSGHLASPLTRTVHVVDNTPPVITLNGEAEITLMVGSAFEDPGATAMDSCGDLDLTSEIALSGAVDTSTPGVYTLTYSVTDDAANTGEVIRTVTVSAGDAPVITLEGANPFVVQCGTEFIDPGASAQDTEDGDLTADIVVVGDSVNTQAPAVYTVTYTVEDNDGNPADPVSREVSVLDTTPPDIVLEGAAYIEVPLGGTFTDPGATAMDSCGNVDLSGSIIVTGGPIDTSIAKTYTLTYQARDVSGNMANVERQVKVWIDEPPVITLSGANPYEVECGEVFIDPGAQAMDTPDGDITASIIVSGDTVDSHAPGSYVITYNVKDSQEQAATAVTRIVTVKDTRKPDITLLGENPMKLEYGDAFTEPGVLATDACDGDISDAVKISGDTVNTNVPRNYTRQYTVKDSNDNERTALRQVVVLPRNSVYVPNLFNLTVKEAQAALSKAELVLGAVTEAYHNSVTKDHIISQSPKSGSNALSGDSVSIEVSKGPQALTEGEEPEFEEGEGEGEETAGEEGEGEVNEGENENEDETAPTGCGCIKSGIIYNRWKRMVGDFVLLGLGLVTLLGMSSMKR